jgi:flagellar L-ring protein precursor FlgH
MKTASLALTLLLTAAACTPTYIEEKESEAFAPVYPEDAYMDSNALPTGAIYTASSGGIFASDRRAARVGDILTVQFVERFQASKSQSASGSRANDYALNMPDILPLGLDNGALTSGTDQSYQGRGQAQQSNSLTGRLSVQVVRVLPGGMLEVMGQKRLTLNQGNEYVRLTGVVRPEDISSDNVVQSDRIAHAMIKYVGAGTTHDTSRPGWLRRGLDAVSPL